MRKILKNNQSNIIVSIIFLLIVFLISKKVIDRKVSLSDKENIYYGIGEIVDFNWGAKTPARYNYVFYVNDKIYKGNYSIADTLALKNGFYLRKKIGKRYLIKYNIKKPLFSEMNIYKPAPDSLYDCLKCVWKEMPF